MILDTDKEVVHGNTVGQRPKYFPKIGPVVLLQYRTGTAIMKK